MKHKNKEKLYQNECVCAKRGTKDRKRKRAKRRRCKGNIGVVSSCEESLVEIIKKK